MLDVADRLLGFRGFRLFINRLHDTGNKRAIAIGNSITRTSCFDTHYKNTLVGATAYNPKVLLKIVLYGYSRGLVSSRRIAECCRDDVKCMALSGGAELVVDAGFHTEENMEMLFKEGIDAYVADNHFRQRDPRFASAERHKEVKAKKDGRFKPLDFIYDKNKQTCICPAGHKMYLKNIRSNLGLFRFTLRGKLKVDIQWKLFNIVHNIGKIFRYGYAAS